MIFSFLTIAARTHVFAVTSVTAISLVLLSAEIADAQLSTTYTPSVEVESGARAIVESPSAWIEPERIQSTLQVMMLMAALSVAPAILLMTTCYVRIVIVLQLLRQAIGMQQLPPTQVITTISIFVTGLVMWPVWTEVHEQSIEPYRQAQGAMEIEEAWQLGIQPIRRFMSEQILATKNADDVMLFYAYLPEGTPPPQTFDDVPLQALLPAYVLSELKTAFLLGFQIYLPFLVIDLVVSSVTVSMGMLMLPPSLVSLPLKLLLFVLADGWHLVIGMLLESFVT